MLLHELGILLFVASQFRAVGGGLAQDVDFRCTLLVLQRRYVALELFEQVLQADSSLTLHVVVQVALLDCLELLLIDLLLLVAARTHFLLLAVRRAVSLVAIVDIVVAVFAVTRCMTLSR